MAEKFAVAHEDWPKETLKEKSAGGFTGGEHTNMDLHNNKVGREIGSTLKIQVLTNQVYGQNIDSLLAQRVKSKIDNGNNKKSGLYWIIK